MVSSAALEQLSCQAHNRYCNGVTSAWYTGSCTKQQSAKHPLCPSVKDKAFCTHANAFGQTSHKGGWQTGWLT
eukprot:6491370-Amphidinium_carterae.2